EIEGKSGVGPILSIGVHRRGEAGRLDGGQRAKAGRGRVGHGQCLHLGDSQHAHADHDDCHHDLDETEAARVGAGCCAFHQQVSGFIACVWVLSMAGAMTRQRVQAPLAVESCRVMVVVTNPAAVLAKPSRLYVIAVTLWVALKVSGTWPLNAPCTRSTVSPASTVAFVFGSENTIQPFAQAVPPVQPTPSAETQVVTVWPSLMASERAYCRSPRSPLTSADMRYALMMQR